MKKHKLITYPRSDSRYLPVEQHSQAPSVIEAINRNCTAFEPAKALLNPSQKSKAWNDKKVDAHHAIIPTAKSTDLDRLGKRNAKSMSWSPRQYLYHFCHRISTSKQGRDHYRGWGFTASCAAAVRTRWKVLAGKQTDKDDQEQQLLPPLTQGQTLQCERGEVPGKNDPAGPNTSPMRLAGGDDRYLPICNRQ